MVYSIENIKEYFDAVAPKRDYWKKKNKYYYDYIEAFVAFLVPEERTVLEIGSGTGDLLAMLKPSYGLGIDISPKTVEIAKSKHKNVNIEFKVDDICKSNHFSEKKFDFIVLSDVTSYLSDVENSFRNLGKFSNPETRIIVTQHSHLWQPILEWGSRVGLRMPSLKQNWLSTEDITNLLYLSGFEVIKKGPKILLPIYIPLISSFFNRFLVNLFPFNKLAFVHYIIAKPIQLSQNQDYAVSIIVPARNEAGTVQKIIDEIPTLGRKTELIFVENNSTDNTLQVLEQTVKNYKGSNVVKFTSKKTSGKKEAVYTGFDMASGDILMIYDADMTVPAYELHKFYDALTHGRGEFINGSRLVYPMESQSMRFLNILGNKFFSIAFSWLLGQRIKDTLCGTKVIWKKDFEYIKKEGSFFGDFDKWGDFDLLFGACKLNLKIVDLPIHYKERTYGVSNMRRWQHGWMLLKMVVFAARKIKFI